MKKREFNKKIAYRLGLTFLIPLIFIILVFDLVVYFLSFNGLEHELSKRLISIGNSAGTQIPVYSILDLVEGDENTRLYKNVREKIIKLKDANNVKRIYIFRTDNTSLVDTEPTIIDYKYPRHEFDKSELAHVLKGESMSSVLFIGKDNKYYKTGYTPVYTEDKEDMVIIGVEGSVEFYETLGKLKRNIVWSILAGIIAVVLASIVFSRRITRPIQNLVQAAIKISEGELDVRVGIETEDEIGLLSSKFNEMRESILERDSRMQMMLRGIAHEVRNPLGGIELFAGLLDEEAKGNEQAKNHVNMIKKEVRNLREIVNEFLDYAKELVLDIRPTDIKQFIEECAIIVKKEMDDKKVSFEYKLPKDISRINIDPEQMRRVFLNLFENAIQATPVGGHVSILVKGPNDEESADKNTMRIIFNDTGVGIKVKDKEKLFTPFFTTKERGTGLGLAFVKKIVEEHEGTVDIRSEEGRGTDVVINIPV